MSKESIRLPSGHPKIFDTMKIEILLMENGESELSMPFIEEYTQHYGMLHGGAIFTLADAACGVAVASVAREGKKVPYVRNEYKLPGAYQGRCYYLPCQGAQAGENNAR